MKNFVLLIAFTIPWSGVFADERPPCPSYNAYTILEKMENNTSPYEISIVKIEGQKGYYGTSLLVEDKKAKRFYLLGPTYDYPIRSEDLFLDDLDADGNQEIIYFTSDEQVENGGLVIISKNMKKGKDEPDFIELYINKFSFYKILDPDKGDKKIIYTYHWNDMLDYPGKWPRFHFSELYRFEDGKIKKVTSGKQFTKIYLDEIDRIKKFLKRADVNKTEDESELDYINEVYEILKELKARTGT